MNLRDFDPATPLDFEWNVDEEEYRADPRLNFHTLAQFHRDPRAWRDGFFDASEETDAMRLGTALHAKLLTRDDYEDKVAVFTPPINPKTGERYGATTKTFQEARDAFHAENAGKTIISASDSALIDRMIEEFFFHPIAPKLLSGKWTKTEWAVCGALSYDEQNLVEVKGRIDAYSPAGLIDVKTTATLDDASGRDRFRYAIYDYKYLIQLAFYHLILTDCLGAPFVPCWLVVFERNAPNRVAVYAPTRDVLESARDVARSWLAQWTFAQRDERFVSRYASIQMIENYDPNRDY